MTTGDAQRGEVRCEWLTIAADVGAWKAIGLAGHDDVDGSWFVPLHGTGLRIVSPMAGKETGIVSWALSGLSADAPPEVDGLATVSVESAGPVFAQHELGASAIDHVVVLTNDLSRTTGAIEAATRCELKRVREVGEIRQGFHRMGRGGLVVEVVARPDVVEGPASFWGLVLNVDDLNAACALLGDLVGDAKEAVQPGRRIATLHQEAGLGLPVALMSV